MPPLTRWFVKTSFAYLALALLTGLLLEIQSTLKLTSLSGIFPVYIQLFVVGWLTQLIFGVVFWMFPKYSAEHPRGSETLGWWTYALLNIGLVLCALAGLCFVINSWGTG